MPNVKISAATDIVSLNSSDMFPVARSGSSTPYHATAAEISSFASVTVSAGAYGNVGRNLLHNALARVQQRGAGPFAAAGYGLDRWETLLGSGDTVSIIAAAISDAQRTQIGDEAAVWSLYNTFTGAAAAGSYVLIAQRIEGVRRLAGKTVTVSFWAIAGSGTPKLGVSIDQVFGTGGSPTAPVLGNGQAVTLSTTFTRYTLTFAIASSSGMTLGSNGNDCTQLNFWYSSGSTNATRSGNVGVQAAAIGLWGIQLEIGSAATPLEKLEPRIDAENCQRFYCAGTGTWSFYASAASQNAFFTVPFSVIMRATPTVAVTGSGGGAWSVVTGYTAEPDNFVIEAASSAAASPIYFNYSYTASAEL